MIEADTLKQLEDALSAYREDQDTLKPVVAIAEQALGDEWVNKLPSELAAALADNPKASELTEKAEHVVHYYGALTAWEEATSYVSGKESYTLELLQERVPVLEYWLKLFGDEGDALMSQVKELMKNAESATANVSEVVQEAPVEEVVAEPEVQVPAEAVVEEKVDADMPEPIAADEIVSEESILDTPKEETVENEATAQEIASTETAEDILPETQEQPEAIANDENTQAEEVPVADQVGDKPVTLSKEDKDIPILDVLEEVDQANNNAQAEGAKVPDNASVAEKELSELEQLRSVDGETPVFQANDYTGLDMPTAEVEQEKKEEAPEEKGPEIQDVSSQDYANAATESKNWDIALFLRQKKLYEEACNWLSAWCIRMDGADKTEYPYYGFIVDLMYDLKDKANNILDNQLLDEIVEKDVEGGRDTVEKVVEALNKEIDGLPDDLKLSTPEKIKLSARDILGQIDTSTDKEDIDAPPDGFELMDDPYAVSTEQIISDFEKTERETEKKIDNLNVIDENK